MSGGEFDYIQYRFEDIATQIDIIIKNNSECGDKWEPNNFSKKTIEEFKKGAELIRKAQIYLQRIDWLVSGDDGEDCFHTRLKEDIGQLTPQQSPQRRVTQLENALEDACNVLADYAGKGKLSDELYKNTTNVIPAGHASRCHLRIKQALDDVEEISTKEHHPGQLQLP